MISEVLGEMSEAVERVLRKPRIRRRSVGADGDPRVVYVGNLSIAEGIGDEPEREPEVKFEATGIAGICAASKVTTRTMTGSLRRPSEPVLRQDWIENDPTSVKRFGGRHQLSPLLAHEASTR